MNLINKKIKIATQEDEKYRGAFIGMSITIRL